MRRQDQRLYRGGWPLAQHLLAVFIVAAAVAFFVLALTGMARAASPNQGGDSATTRSYGNAHDTTEAIVHTYATGVDNTVENDGTWTSNPENEGWSGGTGATRGHLIRDGGLPARDHLILGNICVFDTGAADGGDIMYFGIEKNGTPEGSTWCRLSIPVTRPNCCAMHLLTSVAAGDAFTLVSNGITGAGGDLAISNYSLTAVAVHAE